MESEDRNGRAVGIFLLLQMASALILPFVLMSALVRGYPAYLETAASSSMSIRAGVALAFVGAGLTLCIGIWMFRVLRRYSERAAIWFLAVCAISCALDAVHNGTVLSMLGAGEAVARAAGADTAAYHGWAASAGSLRRTAHIVQLVAIGAWMMSFYVLLWRFRLVPRVISTLGILGVASQISGVTVMMFLGNSPIGYLAMPIAPIHAATAIWLIVKGFPADPNAADERFDS